MVKFKVLKYKHYQRAVELQAELQAEDSVLSTELTGFVMSLVEAWDFTDIETGEPIEPGQPSELSLEQFQTVMTAFNLQFNRDSQVKKTSGEA